MRESVYKTSLEEVLYYLWTVPRYLRKAYHHLTCILTHINFNSCSGEGKYKGGENLAGAGNDAHHRVIQLHEVTEDTDGKEGACGNRFTNYHFCHISG